MEQANSDKRHGHIVFIACFDNIIITNGTAALRNKFYAGFMGAFDIVAEREECIRA